MKKILYILGGSAAALVLAAFIFLLTVNINSYRPRFEAAASEAIGMKVRMDGKMKLMLFPHTGVSLEDLLIQNGDADIASVKKAELEMSLLPLLWQGIHIQQIKLITPAFFITRDRSGRFNVETPGKEPSGKEFTTGQFKMKNIVIKGGDLLYLDETSGRKTEAKDCDLEIKNISGGGGKFLGSFSSDGDLSCGEVRVEEVRISDIRLILKARPGKFEAAPIIMKIFGGDGKGSITGVMTEEAPEYVVDFSVLKLRFEEVLAQFNQKNSIYGGLDLKLHLTMKGKNTAQITRTAHGDLSIRGQDLIHESLDLDLVLEKYENSQNFNLVDVAAFFVAGPLGTLLTKGYNFGSIYTASTGGKSTMPILVSDWKIKNGVAEAEDVAFSTRQSRVALRGRLDFVNEQFENMTAAVVDEKGCVRFSQKIQGPFRHPVVEKVSTLESIAGPILSLFEETEGVFKGGECEIFYAGSVPHPK